MRTLKLTVSGKKAVVPTSITDTSEQDSYSRPVSNNMKTAGGGYTNYIPNRAVSGNEGKYTAPPKRVPFAYIPRGCKGCH